jgi:hypothetical protein
MANDREIIFYLYIIINKYLWFSLFVPILIFNYYLREPSLMPQQQIQFTLQFLLLTAFLTDQISYLKV